MNKKQKIILAIFIPIIIFFIVLLIASSVSVTTGGYVKGKYFNFVTHTHDPFDWETTWYVWMLYLIFCCIFEYKLFEDKKIIINKKKKNNLI